MTRDEAQERAAQWVQANYPVVPPLSLVTRFSERLFNAQEPQSGRRVPAEGDQPLRDKWLIAYSCSRDTDALGMPKRLLVLVDDVTGDVEPVSPTS